MKDAKFGSALNLVVAKAGKKTVGATRPELVLLPTLNRFALNNLATELMKLESGDTVTLLVNPDATSFDEKFYITKGFGDSVAMLASTGKAKGYGRVLTFNYSGIYSQIIQGSADAKETSAEGLAEMNLMKSKVTDADNISYSALRKVFCEVVSVGEQEVDGETQEVYSLRNSKIRDYTPRDMEGSAEEDISGSTPAEDELEG